MTTNTSVTLFHKVYNKEKHLDEWKKYLINNAMWQGGKGASINKGYEKANDISIWLPYYKNEDLKNIPFSIGDIVVKGIVNEEISKESDLNDPYNITTLINYDYGSYNMQHIFIGAK